VIYGDFNLLTDIFNPVCREISTFLVNAAGFCYFIGMSRFIDQSAAVQALSALAQDTRMTAFRTLVAAYPDSIGAGDIARGCEVPQNTMSTHLGILTRAGLLRVERDGRQMNYQADIDGFRAVVMYLARDCCDRRGDLCASLIADLASDRAIGKVGSKASTRSDRAKPAEKPRR
jgi:ArsR family transcriptional regulator, arsenate/arsenite/antimonite-responsive transcriptional repressor